MSDIPHINAEIEELEDHEKELVSDGYHTFKELYEHRVVLFVALITALMQQEYHPSNKICWKSKKHADGTMYDGWFIAGIGLEKWDTLTYHLPISEWDNLYCDTLENAPEWDGHTSKDVIRLLRNI